MLMIDIASIANAVAVNTRADVREPVRVPITASAGANDHAAIQGRGAGKRSPPCAVMRFSAWHSWASGCSGAAVRLQLVYVGPKRIHTPSVIPRRRASTGVKRAARLTARP